jgi:hypothetical protein
MLQGSNMARIVVGIGLAIWSIVVLLSNYDFWDGFVFPVACGSAGVYLIISGRDKMIRESHRGNGMEASRHTGDVVAQSAADELKSSQIGEAGKFALSVASTVVSAIILKLLGAS